MTLPSDLPDNVILEMIEGADADDLQVLLADPDVQQHLSQVGFIDLLDLVFPEWGQGRAVSSH